MSREEIQNRKGIERQLIHKTISDEGKNLQNTSKVIIERAYGPDQRKWAGQERQQLQGLGSGQGVFVMFRAT